MKKEIAIVGLGKMGAGIARRLLENGWVVHGFDASQATVEALSNEGLKGARSLSELVQALPQPRLIWLMAPHGEIVEKIIFGENGLTTLLSADDIVIDGANSFYKDAIRRGQKLKEKGIHFMDVGVSGGLKVAREGACLMVGGDEAIFKNTEPLFQDLANSNGYAFFQGHGAGHFVKMVHNGIEYGMMQTLAEGFELLKKSDYHLNLSKIAEVYNQGSIIESKLVGWLANALKQDGEDLDGISAVVGHTGEGEWTAQTAKEMGVDVQSIEQAFKFRVDSAKNPRFAGKVVSALREQFGGHDVKEKSA